MSRPIIVWFRNDLRVSDHPALTKAVASGAAIVPLYVFCSQSPALRQPGGAISIDHALSTLR